MSVVDGLCRAVSVCGLLAAAGAAGTARGQMTFVDVTAASGISYVQHPYTMGGQQQYYYTGGATCGDYNNDGWIDIFVTRMDDTDILYQNNGDGTFTDVTLQAFGPTPLVALTNGCQTADIVFVLSVTSPG